MIFNQIPGQGVGAITIQLTNQITQYLLIQTVTAAKVTGTSIVNNSASITRRHILSVVVRSNQSGNALVPVAVNLSFYPHVSVCNEQLKY